MAPVRSRRGRVALVASLVTGTAAVALVGAACSSDDEAAAAGAVAEFIPASAPLYVEVSTDFEGAQWTQAEALLKRFPNAPSEGITDVLNDAFEEEGIDYETRVRPLLGATAVLGATPELPSGLGALDVGSASESVGDTSVVAALELAEGTEDEALALLTTEADVTEVGEHEGATIYESNDGDTFVAVTAGAIVLADTRVGLEGAIDAQRRGGDATLANDDTFTAAMGRLPEGTFGRIYIDIGTFVQQAAAEDPQSAEALRQLADLGDAAIAASVTTEDEGIRLQGVIEGQPEGQEAAPFSPTLLQNAPADALAYVGFADLATSVSRTVQQQREAGNDQVATQLDALTAQLPALLGVTVDDLGALTSGEHAVIVADAPVGTPAAALALQVADGSRAKTTLDALRAATPLAGQQLGLPPGTDWSPVPLANGVRGWRLPLDGDADVVYGVDGQLAIVGTSPQIVRQVQNPGATLAGDEDFQVATEGMPGEVTGLIWLDPPELIAAVEAADGFDREDQQSIDTLRSIDGIAAWTVPGDVPTFEAFARIAG